MSDFEDNNPFSESGRRLSSSSGLTSDIAPFSNNNTRGLGPNATSDSLANENGLNGIGNSSVFEDNNPFGGDDRSSTDGFSHPSDAGNQYDNKIPASESTDTPKDMPKVFSSRIEHILYTDPDIAITIVDAGKSHEGSSRGFISYTVKLKDISVRRRYSEFESLRNILVKLFPTLIIPPIPEKHSMSDYAASPTKAKEDASIIDHRRRMLAVFLNRCKAMPQVKASSVYQRFLDPNSSWSEVLNSPPVSTLPKNILKAPPLDPSTESVAHSYLPIPPSSAKLRTQEDPAFQNAEINAKEYENVIVHGLEKVNRRIIKRYTDISNDFQELGARFNSFSLEEKGSVATSIETVGQAFDHSYIATEALVSSLSSSFSEPLGESAQFASVVRSVLKYHRQKALQLEMTADSLASKKSSLKSLEKVEQEAQRINAYLHRDNLGDSLHSDFSGSASIHQHRTTPSASGALSAPAPLTPSVSKTTEATANDSHASTEQDKPATSESAEAEAEPTTSDNSNSAAEDSKKPALPHADESFPPTHADTLTSPGTLRKKKGGFKIPGIGKLNSAFHGIIDNDPEATRRNNIGKTKEQISELEIALQAAKEDLGQASESVKADMERFQKNKEEDLRQMMRAYIQCHIEWAEKNLESWQRAKAEINKI